MTTKQIEYRKRLDKECMYVTYKKTNGDLRTMYCTRSAHEIKKLGYKPFMFSKGRAYNQEKKYAHQLFVCDLDIGDARIINLETIVEETFAATYAELLVKHPKSAPISNDIPTPAPSQETLCEKELEDIF